jgi:hypothetical protein
VLVTKTPEIVNATIKKLARTRQVPIFMFFNFHFPF